MIYLCLFDRGMRIGAFQREILVTTVDKSSSGFWPQCQSLDPHQLNFHVQMRRQQQGFHREIWRQDRDKAHLIRMRIPAFRLREDGQRFKAKEAGQIGSRHREPEHGRRAEIQWNTKRLISSSTFSSKASQQRTADEINRMEERGWSYIESKIIVGCNIMLTFKRWYFMQGGRVLIFQPTLHEIRIKHICGASGTAKGKDIHANVVSSTAPWKGFPFPNPTFGL